VGDIRDYFLPAGPGTYIAVYDYWYATGQLNDRNGNKVSSVTVGRPPGVKVDVGIDVNVYAISPMLIWEPKWKVLGARVAPYIAPSFSNSSISASLTTATGSGRNAHVSQFGVGDMFVCPIWLGWLKKHSDFALGYGFYAPIGTYNVETVTLPGVGSVKTTAPDNIGLGYWEHQIQGAGVWFPWADQRMAVTSVLTYEINQNKKDFDLSPGDRLTLNWGVDRYLALNEAKTLQLDIGAAGYNSWQVADDTGSDASNPGVHDSVGAVGGQVGLTFVPHGLFIGVVGFYEYAATDRFQGHSIGLNVIKKF
jgi:hypothetical protein